MPNTLARTFALRLSILFLFSVFAASPSAQDARPSPKVRVIPLPRQETVAQETFQITPGASIVLADPRSEDDRFAAQDFIDDVKETAGVSLMIGKGRARLAIVIGLIDLPLIQAALKRAGMESSANLDREGYVLSVSATAVVIGGRTAAGVFHGLPTLKQLARGEASTAFIQGVKISDWPAMRWRGVSDDISRGPIPTVAYIKCLLRTFAAFKLNMHSFYMEHTFASEANPLMGPAGGLLTPDEVRELVAYARSCSLGAQDHSSAT